MRRMIPRTTARIVRPIDAGDAEADRRGPDVAVADRFLHHVVEDLLDLELADRLQVRAAAARFADHSPVSSASWQTVFVPPASMPSTCTIVHSNHRVTSEIAHTWSFTRSAARDRMALAERAASDACMAALVAIADRGARGLAALVAGRSCAVVIAVPPACGRARRAKCARSGCTPILADHARQHRLARQDRARSRLQHAARAGARARRRLLRERLEPRPPISRGSRRRSIRSRTVLADAQATGIRVHAWVTLNLVSSAGGTARLARSSRLPPSRMADGAARDRAGARAPRSRQSRLRRQDRALDARSAARRVEGLYASPLQPDAAAYTERVVADLARRYDLDGVHLDYARYPNQQFDYSRFAIAEFRADMRPQLGADARRALDAARKRRSVRLSGQLPGRVEGVPPRAPDGARRAASGRACTPRGPTRRAHRGRRFPIRRKPSTSGCRTGAAGSSAHLVDAVAPMAYTQEPARFAEQIAAARDIAGGRADLGRHRRLPPDPGADASTTSRPRAGSAPPAFVLFSYDSLTGPKPPAPDYLATVSRAAFGARARSTATQHPIAGSDTRQCPRASREVGRRSIERGIAVARLPRRGDRSRHAATACCGAQAFGTLTYARTPPRRPPTRSSTSRR